MKNENLKSVNAVAVESDQKQEEQARSRINDFDQAFGDAGAQAANDNRPTDGPREHEVTNPDPDEIEVEEVEVTSDTSSGNARVLLPHHLRHLQASGLTEATISALDIHSETDPEKIRQHLRLTATHEAEKLGPCLVFPYPGVKGYAKLKPDNARLIGEKPPKMGDVCGHNVNFEEVDERKPVKYESPRGGFLHIYAPEVICPGLLDRSQTLYIVEGEKKAALACQEGVPAISIPGVYSAHDVDVRLEAQDWGGHEFTLNGEALKYVLPGREVCILFDAPDIESNVQVTRAAVRLARMINDAGAKALVGFLPNVTAPKTGLDDYYVYRRARIEHSSYGVLDGDFADARPVGPNEHLDWLIEEKRDRGWAPKEVRVELRRAAIWSRAWHEHDNREFGKWVQRASAKLHFEKHDIHEMVKHLRIGLKKGDGDAEKWKRFDDQKLLFEAVPILDKAFRVHRDSNGVDKIFKVNDRNEVTLQLAHEPLEQLIYDALKEKYGGVPPPKVLKRSIEVWVKECEKLDTEPEPFTFKGDSRLCFKHFDWEPTEGPYSAWEEFLSRLTDAEAFMAYVWSCFEPRSKSRQFVWLRGEGQDGKSCVLRTIQHVFGPAAAGIGNTHLKNQNQFLFSAIYGKRVVVYSDCKNAKFGMTEFVRNCTSGDAVQVEFKGKTGFSWNMYVKLFVASNPKPEYTSQASDLSRVIYIEVAESKSKDDPTWAARLEEELPAFLFACRETYNRCCPHHGDIKLSDRTKELLGQAAIAFEERYHDIFERNFKHRPGAEAAASVVSERLREAGLNNNDISDFKAWMDRTYGVKYDIRNNGRFYVNLMLINIL